MEIHPTQGPCARDRKPPRRKPKPTANPLQAGIALWCAQRYPERSLSIDISHLPKRFTLYSPLLLLPANFTQHSIPYEIEYTAQSESQQEALFACIAEAFTKSGKPVTHIALAAPIPSSGTVEDLDNVLRSPSGLLPLLGSFGPPEVPDSVRRAPKQIDFEQAFWVDTSQTAGIHQVWAPQWTMFSRGNLSEKTRILRKDDRLFPGLSEKELGSPLSQVDVVDLYIGIGYFAFSYLKVGVRRVWGWDLNPWSIEGLRKGCEKNGWRCLVVHVPPTDVSFEQRTGVKNDSHVSSTPLTIPELDRVLQMIEEADSTDNPIRCVAFLGDNCSAASIVGQLHGHPHNVRHVNLGLLPSSRLSWAHAVKVVSDKGGWLHIHENVPRKEINIRTSEILSSIDQLLVQRNRRGWHSSCEHVEQVKNFGPGVVHCVYDVNISPDAE